MYGKIDLTGAAKFSLRIAAALGAIQAGIEPRPQLQKVVDPEGGAAGRGQRKGIRCLGIVNTVGSTIARESDGGVYIQGPEVARFEAAAASALGVAHAVAVSSGSDALLVALWALGVGPGDEVLCPAFTFVAPVEAVVRLGATPAPAPTLPGRSPEASAPPKSAGPVRKLAPSR